MQFIGKWLQWETVPPDFTDLEYLPPMPVETPTEPALSPTEAIYRVAKESLDKRLALNPSVPKEVGCVTAVAAVLKKTGYSIHSSVVGVNALIEWLINNGFKESDKREIGVIITAHRPRLSDSAFAHVGICGKTHIMSNTSFSDSSKGLVAGLWQANYTHASWDSFYKKHGLVTRYFVHT